MKSRNPFFAYQTEGRDFYYTDAASRMRAVESFDLKQCRAALKVDPLQVTVRRAIERQIRKLERAA